MQEPHTIYLISCHQSDPNNKHLNSKPTQRVATRGQRSEGEILHPSITHPQPTIKGMSLALRRRRKRRSQLTWPRSLARNLIFAGTKKNVVNRPDNSQIWGRPCLVTWTQNQPSPYREHATHGNQKRKEHYTTHLPHKLLEKELATLGCFSTCYATSLWPPQRTAQKDTAHNNLPVHEQYGCTRHSLLFTLQVKNSRNL